MKLIDAFMVLVTGYDDDDNEVGLTEGPFRTKDTAEKWAKLVHPGHDFTVMVTLIEPGERCKGLPRKRTKAR